MMDLLDQWAEAFTAFLGRFAGLFGRSEPREQMAKYVRALLATLTRKNGWQLAEGAGDVRPDRMQRLLYRAHWDADAARDTLRQYIVEALGDPEAIGIVDETGFLKKGTCSVGVKRQYSGTAGRTENCQVATFLAYATARGRTLLDRRLYLPEEWCADAGGGAADRDVSDQAAAGAGDAAGGVGRRGAHALGHGRCGLRRCDLRP
jgi:SRSO17 transposase